MPEELISSLSVYEKDILTFRKQKILKGVF